MFLFPYCNTTSVGVPLPPVRVLLPPAAMLDKHPDSWVLPDNIDTRRELSPSGTNERARRSRPQKCMLRGGCLRRRGAPQRDKRWQRLKKLIKIKDLIRKDKRETWKPPKLAYLMLMPKMSHFIKKQTDRIIKWLIFLFFNAKNGNQTSN